MGHWLVQALQLDLKDAMNLIQLMPYVVILVDKSGTQHRFCYACLLAHVYI